MNPIKISTGTVTIPVERDGVFAGTISFNPSDAMFMARYEQLTIEIAKKQEEINQLEKADHNTFVEICNFVNGQIDRVFGESASSILFGGACVFKAYQDFFSGLAPVIAEARKQKLNQYLSE